MTIEVGERVAAPVIPAKKIPSILRHAALVIEERGWCQDTLYDFDGRVCVIGALNTAQFGTPGPTGNWAVDPIDALSDYLDTEAVAGWNDDDARTAAEVTAALRAAADAYEAR